MNFIMMLMRLIRCDSFCYDFAVFFTPNMRTSGFNWNMPGAQILCVTHQPQVASQGHQHLFVSKDSRGELTRTRIDTLSRDRRVEEVARMLGGIEITDTSLEHAREMLKSA